MGWYMFVAAVTDTPELALVALASMLSLISIAFAGDVLDSLLKWGLVVVAYDEDEELKDRASKVPAANGAKRNAVLAPLVPPRECIEIAYRQSGRMGYTRKYVVFNMAAPIHATKVDEDARVYIREQPDSVGNVISPMSKCFELGSFVTALTELALTAEITNARPRYAGLDVARHACYNLTPPAPRAGCGRSSARRSTARASKPISSSLIRKVVRCSPTSTRRATPKRPSSWRCSLNWSK